MSDGAMRMIQTAELRFITRHEPVVGKPEIAYSRRILQQKWVADLFAADVLITNPSQYDEWRDVPLIEEVADASR